MSNSPEALLLLPHLRIQNANMISGPLTWGFPAPSGFAGFVHALSRRIEQEFQLKLDGVGIVCHKFDPQVFQPPGRRTNVLRLTRNPLKKDGKTASIVEEGRVHLEVSLVIGVSGEGFWDEEEAHSLAERLYEIALSMRIAGGSVLPGSSHHYKPSIEIWPEDLEGRDKFTRRYRRKLLPGFALVERQDVLEEHREQLAVTDKDITYLDALLDLCKLHTKPDPAATANDKHVEWTVERAKPGWLVPVPLGFAAISQLYEPGEVLHTRDPTVPFRFVESTLGLGQWLSPHRISNLQSLFWHYEIPTDDGLYGCRNHYSTIEQTGKD